MIPIRKILHHKMMIQSSGSSYKDRYNHISFIVHNSFFLLLFQYLPQYNIASFSSSHILPFCLIYFARLLKIFILYIYTMLPSSWRIHFFVVYYILNLFHSSLHCILQIRTSFFLDTRFICFRTHDIDG